MGNFRGIIISGLMTAAICFAAPALAATDVLSIKKAEAATLKKKTGELENQVSSLKDRLVSTASTMRGTEESIASSNQKLSELKAKKAAAQKRFSEEYQALGGVVGAAQRYSRTSTPDLLVQSEPVDAARASLIMKSLIPALNARSDALKAQLANLTKIEGEIGAQLAAQSKEYNKLKEQQGDLSGLLKEREAVYNKTITDRKAREEEVARLAKSARDLADLSAKLKLKEQQDRRKKPAAGSSTPDFAALRLPSSIPQPVAGAIKVSFGATDELGGRSEGLTFAAPAGATVVTPLAGRVKFAGPFQKFKQILIVEHPGGYHSLIAGLGKIDTVVGASLASGEPIGTAETLPDARIYFELRKGGEPVNPRQLLVAQRKQDKS
ncbi:MAG: murein hydrolase activator EnvC [Alphaproteobacteria bacterium]